VGDGGGRICSEHLRSPVLEFLPTTRCRFRQSCVLPDDVRQQLSHVPQPARCGSGQLVGCRIAQDAIEQPQRRAVQVQERLVLARYDTRSHGVQEMHCRVVLRRGEQEFSGAGEGTNTTQGRAEAAARALFAALAASRGRDDLALEGATLLETLGRTFVLVSAHALAGRQTVPLTGAAALGRSPEEAAILASLQATNRWAELPS